MKSTIPLAVFLFMSLLSKAQTDSTKAPTSSSSYTIYFDGYYKNDFSKQSTNNKTSFTNSNQSLQLGMASIKLDHTNGKFAGTLDLGLGKRAQEFSYNDKGVAQSIKQAYISYAPMSGLKISAGKWATHIGYELLDAYSNRNYSMSYGFSYGPFFHTGIRADIALGGKSAMMIGLAQPTDFVSAASPDKMLIAQFSTSSKNDVLKAFLNYQGGKDKSQFDLVLNGVVNTQVAINYDGTIANIAGNNWTSNAVYVNYDPSAKIGFTLRSEYFDDSKNAVGVGSSIFQNTFSANIHFSKLTLIPEIRFDNAKDKIFFNTNNNLNQYASNFLIAAVYKF
ncbi:MAG: porin [Chitinophagaceae bacterium]|jgi:hypothetical protein|nr:porin [Chitinophagaceae bacterium]